MKPYPRCVDNCPFIYEGKCIYREKHIPTVAVDFDKVLFEHDGWDGHENYGSPISNARESLLELQQMGFKIMIWTTRCDEDIIRSALLKYNIPFDYINQNPNQPPDVATCKPVADYYIDDRAVRFTTWLAVLNEIKEREKNDRYYSNLGKEV